MDVRCAIGDIEFSEKRSKLNKQALIQNNVERRASFVIFKQNHHYFLLRPR